MSDHALLILGLGNVLCGDDGLGAAAVARLARERVLPPGVDLLGALAWRGCMPRRLVLLGLVPETLELRLGRSPAVEAGLPALVAAVVDEAERLGARLAPRPTHESEERSADRELDRILGL